MSVTPTNSTKYQEFHGIKLAANAEIANLVVEKLSTDPVTPTVGRFWYNTTSNKFKLVSFNGTDASVETFVTETELNAAITALETALAATTGATLVGYKGATGTNAKFSITAGTLESATDALASAIDAEIKGREDADTQAAADLVSVVADASGASKIGYDGKVGTNGKVIVATGMVDASLDSLVDQMDAALSALGDDAVSKSTLDDQVIASNVRVSKNLIIDGDFTVLGENTLIQGETVQLGDNIILLNGNLGASEEPKVAAGWQVNRGIRGPLDAILWDETTKVLTGTTVTTDEFDVETSVRSRVILGTEFELFNTDVTTRLGDLEDQVDGKMGDLTTLATEDKTTLVAAINELHSDSVTDRGNLVAATGSTLVGYKGSVGVNSLLTIVAGTMEATIDAVVTFVDAEAKALDDTISTLASQVTAEGSALVGYVGFGAVEDAFYLPAGSLQTSVSAVVTAIKEDREAIAQLSGASDSLVTAINAQNYVVVSTAKLSHTIVHNLNSDDIAVNVWFKDGSVWVNHAASCKIVDKNTVEFTLTTAVELKVLVSKFDNIVL